MELRLLCLTDRLSRCGCESVGGSGLGNTGVVRAPPNDQGSTRGVWVGVGGTWRGLKPRIRRYT